jgi:hypothetical protein
VLINRGRRTPRRIAAALAICGVALLFVPAATGRTTVNHRQATTTVWVP